MTIEGPFAVGPNTTLQIEKVLSTTANAPSTVAVLITSQWSPSLGVTVKITQTSSAEVTGSGSAFEIFNEPLVRGTDAKIRLKVHNLGTSQMEFLTSENSGQTKKVAVYLKDEDGNLLSTGYLNQRLGNAIIDTGKYATARLNPGDEMTTEPVILNVPVSAPYKVILEATIENTYYHYNKPDQVTAPGMRQFAETTISETAYRAYAEPEYEFYPTAQPVLITGSALSNLPTPDPQSPTPVLVPNVPVKIGVSVKGFDRYYTVTTDADGNFAYTFTPGPNEAGTYSVWAVHPDIKDRTVQSTFVIAGLSISPSSATVRMARGRSLDIPVTLSNYGGGTLTGLTFNTQTSSGITAAIINPGDTVLTAGENAKLTLRITTSSSAPNTGSVTVNVATNEGLSVKIEASISIVSLIPIINTSPSFIDTGMVRGNQKISSFTIKNTGEETLRNARIEGPSTSWISLTVNRELGDIQPGVSKSVGIMFSPSETIPQGVYDDRIVIYSDNHIPYTYHVQVTVTSDAVGNVLFDILNEFMEDVPNATITFQHQLLTELIYTRKTGQNGTVMAYDIPEGRYTYNISPPAGHLPTSGTFVVSPALTTLVPIALQMKLVEVTWSVTPTTIEDHYEITIHQTFETNVPAPVLVTEPPNLTLPEMLPGQILNGEFAVTNYGLVAVDDIKLDFPTSILDYDIEVYTSAIPKRLNAMQKITVPFRITKRQTLAADFSLRELSFADIGSSATDNSQYACSSSPIFREAESSLYDELKGYGSNGCYTPFHITTCGDYVVCPNTPQQRTGQRCTSYTISAPRGCPSGGGSGGSSGGGIYIPPVYGPGTPGQGGGGQTPQPQPSPINTGNPCECARDCTPCGTRSVCVSGTCTAMPEDDPEDCKQSVCDVERGIILVNDDGEVPSNLCKKCEDGQQVNKPDCIKPCNDPEECCIDGDCKRVAIDYVDARAHGEKRIFVSLDDWVYFTGNVSGENCEFQYKYLEDVGSQSAFHLTDSRRFI